MTATLTQGSPRLFAPEQYHYSFLTAVRSELAKARQSIGFWITAACAIVVAVAIQALLVFLMEPISFDPSSTLGMWSFFALFIIPLAVLMVTSEYSQNTMRTTVLAVPNRLVAFAAKMMAVFVFIGLLALAITLTTIATYYIVGSLFGEISFVEPHAFRSMAMMWLVLTTLGLGAAGLAYILRSTAGSITLLIVVLEFASILTLVPDETFKAVLQKVLPDMVAMAAMNTGSHIQLQLSGYLDLWDWPVATAVWLGYMALLVGGGLWRFLRSDI